jgi:hypothetical protein
MKNKGDPDIQEAVMKRVAKEVVEELIEQLYIENEDELNQIRVLFAKHLNLAFGRKRFDVQDSE